MLRMTMQDVKRSAATRSRANLSHRHKKGIGKTPYLIETLVCPQSIPSGIAEMIFTTIFEASMPDLLGDHIQLVPARSCAWVHQSKFSDTCYTTLI